MTLPIEGVFFSLPVASWIGLILDLAVKTTVLFAAAGGAVWCLRRRSASLRSQVWTTAFMLLLLLPALHAIPLVPVGTPLLGSVAPVAVESRPLTLAAPAEASASGAAEHANLASEPAPIGRKAAGRPWPVLLAAVWLAGVALCAVRTFWRLLAGWWVTRRAMPIRDRRLLGSLAAGCRALGLAREVEFRLSRQEAVPFTTGLLRPCLVLPARGCRWGGETLRTVLTHELAHVRRRDLLRLVIQEAACAVAWFHPLVWAAAHRARIEIERACDDVVLRSGIDAEAYARALLGMARAPMEKEGVLAMARRSALEERLHGILDRRAHRDAPRPAVAAAVALLALVASGPLLALPWIGRAAQPEAAIAAIETSVAPEKTDPAELLRAARIGDVDRIGRILGDHPEWIEMRDDKGMTPLSLAAWEGRLGAVAHLAAQGADLDAKNYNGLTPLFCAIDRGRGELTRLLIECGADLATRGYRNRNLLHMAARSGDLSLTRRLLDTGADVNARDRRGTTPLDVAVNRGHTRLVSLLRSRGAVLGAGDHEWPSKAKKRCPNSPRTSMEDQDGEDPTT